MMKSPLIARLFIKSHSKHSDPAVRKAYGTLGGIFGIICNLLLFIIKLAAGLITGSISITADALNNLTDMGSSIITIIGFKMASKPADSDHPFGHGRIEYMASFIVSGLILMVGGELLISSVKNIINPVSVTYNKTAIIILAASVIIKLFMFSTVRSLGKTIDSATLIATAQDSINDSITTAAILVSIPLSDVFSFQLDAYIGLLISLFILYSGLKSAKETLDPLLGQPPTAQMVDDISNLILSFDNFLGIHDLIVHNYGPGRTFASVHVEVSSKSDIVRAHEQIDLCENLVAEKLGILLVIHMDPIATDDEFLAETKAKTIDVLHSIDPALSLHDFRMTPKGADRTNLIFDVVVPSSVKTEHYKLKAQIAEEVSKIDPTFCCVITIDNDFTGR
ncbi:MAG: cation transporter [Clostridia bacterium]|nr:cation transporter [Clostridia bacterium]